MRLLLPVAIFLFTFSAFGQSDLPEIGNLSDLHGKTKFYFIGDNESRKAVLKQIEKKKIFEVVGKSEDAQFFIEYKMISRPSGGLVLGGTGIVGTSEIGQMDVYLYREKKKVIGWSESTTGRTYKGDTANRLIQKFLKAIEKAQK